MLVLIVLCDFDFDAAVMILPKAYHGVKDDAILASSIAKLHFKQST